MHDLDRTQLEADGSGEFESLGDEFEYSYESDNEFESAGLEGEDVLSELDEMELAGDMLEIESEEELDQFIGKLFKKIGAAAKKVVRSPLGKHIGGFLKGAAKKVLPLAGKAIGGAFGGPVGAAIGGKLASGAGDLLGLELEGLSPEDREFEVARQFVRFASATVKNAAAAPPTQPPSVAARSAVASAARRHAPGLIRGNGRTSYAGHGRRTGKWIRRGNRIIIFGV
jgi:uncharacterized protein (DUF697 family)